MLKFVLLASSVALAVPAFAQDTPSATTTPAQEQPAPTEQTAPVTSEAAPADAAPADAAAATQPAQPTQATTQQVQTAPAQTTTTPAQPTQQAQQPATTQDQVAAAVGREFKSYDRNADGGLDKAEFGSWMGALRKASEPTFKPDSPEAATWVSQAFTAADADKSASVNQSELTSFLTPKAS